MSLFCVRTRRNQSCVLIHPLAGALDSVFLNPECGVLRIIEDRLRINCCAFRSEEDTGRRATVARRQAAVGLNRLKQMIEVKQVKFYKK
jgi:hypothetical protein